MAFRSALINTFTIRFYLTCIVLRLAFLINILEIGPIPMYVLDCDSPKHRTKSTFFLNNLLASNIIK